MRTPAPSPNGLVVGLHETLLTEALQRLVDALPEDRVQVVDLDDDVATAALAAHLQRLLRRALSGSAAAQAAVIAKLSAALLAALPERERLALAGELTLALPPRELRSVAAIPTAGPPQHPLRPRTRLSESALLTNAPATNRCCTRCWRSSRRPTLSTCSARLCACRASVWSRTRWRRWSSAVAACAC